MLRCQVIPPNADFGVWTWILKIFDSSEWRREWGGMSDLHIVQRSCGSRQSAYKRPRWCRNRTPTHLQQANGLMVQIYKCRFCKWKHFLLYLLWSVKIRVSSPRVHKMLLFCCLLNPDLSWYIVCGWAPPPPNGPVSSGKKIASKSIGMKHLFIYNWTNWKHAWQLFCRDPNLCLFVPSSQKTYFVLFPELLEVSLLSTEFSLPFGVVLFGSVQLQTFLRVALRQSAEFSLQGLTLRPARHVETSTSLSTSVQCCPFISGEGTERGEKKK